MDQIVNVFKAIIDYLMEYFSFDFDFLSNGSDMLKELIETIKGFIPFDF